MAAFIAAPIASALVEIADTYLPKPLPVSAHDAIEMVIVILVVALVPHNVLAVLFPPQS